MTVDDSLLAEILSKTLSKDHVTVIEKLSKPKHDEDLAAELNLKATVVRTLLNDLHMHNLVEYERSKNKKTGWYTYRWKKRDDKIEEYVMQYLDNRLQELQEQLELEKQGTTFNCSCRRVNMETAMETNFICPGCSEMYVESDGEEIIRKLESEIKKIEKLRNKKN